MTKQKTKQKTAQIILVWHEPTETEARARTLSDGNAELQPDLREDAGDLVKVENWRQKLPALNVPVRTASSLAHWRRG